MQINICYCFKCRLYNTYLPSWLCNKPRNFLEKDIPEKNVKHMDNDNFLIQISITIKHMLIQLIENVTISKLSLPRLKEE